MENLISSRASRIVFGTAECDPRYINQSDGAIRSAQTLPDHDFAFWISKSKLGLRNRNTDFDQT